MSDNEALRARLLTAGWALSPGGSPWRIQPPWCPEFGAEGATIQQAARRLAKLLRDRADAIDMMLAGVDP